MQDIFHGQQHLFLLMAIKTQELNSAHDNAQCATEKEEKEDLFPYISHSDVKPLHNLDLIVNRHWLQI